MQGDMRVKKMLKNERGQLTYCEYMNGHWQRWEFNDRGLRIRWEDSRGKWYTIEYDSNDREICRRYKSHRMIRYIYNDAGVLVRRIDSRY